MALKKFRFGVTIVVADPEKDIAEIRDAVTGNLLQPRQIGTKMIPPDTEIEMEEAEGNRIEAIHPNSLAKWRDHQRIYGPSGAGGMTQTKA